MKPPRLPRLPILGPTPQAGFPDPATAWQYPNGLLAQGGDLSPARLMRAYREGIFPWFSESDPILWWSPDPRAVFVPGAWRPHRSLARRLRRQPFTVRFDTAFERVIAACAAPRGDGNSDPTGTWISPEMMRAYEALHRQGVAHSVEAWQGDALVGGLYGLAIGRVFFGESMFSRATDASKVAFAHLMARLAAWGFVLADAQVESDHVSFLGAESWPRERFLATLATATGQPSAAPADWRSVNVSAEGDSTLGPARPTGDAPAGVPGEPA